ncbi:hypothetical protein ACFV2U_51320 [Streptomyces sp. NPDC059697]|uniref:hypothetical protein n=1 Tax=Streptomyces sp. NPDC059697 TaxID=3346912 RepID=UPI0036C62A0C
MTVHRLLLTYLGGRRELAGFAGGRLGWAGWVAGTGFIAPAPTVEHRYGDFEDPQAVTSVSRGTTGASPRW